MKEYSLRNLLNLEVHSILEGGRIGRVTGYIIEPDQGRLVGLAVKLHGQRASLLVSGDIRYLDAKGIIINQAQDIVENDDVLKVKELSKLGIMILGQRVMTQSKKGIGRVKEAYFESQTFYITRLVVEPYWYMKPAKSRLIDRTQIISVTKKTILIKDDAIALSETEGLIQPMEAA